MKVTNKKTGVSYEVDAEKAEKLLKGPLGKRFVAKKTAAAPPEVKELKNNSKKDKDQASQGEKLPVITDPGQTN